MSTPSQSDDSDLLLVGLGNPGPEYAHTRHNLGWACIDALAARVGVAVDRRRWRSRVGCGVHGGRRLWLLEPQTYMNVSGRAVFEAVRDLGIGAGSVWVVHDELDLPFCRMRIKVGGSAAGNNGVRSIIASLHRDDFVRFRVGVGKPERRGPGHGVDHVLGRFSREEEEALPRVIDGVAAALETAVTSGLTKAMDLYNRAGSLGCEAVS